MTTAEQTYQEAKAKSEAARNLLLDTFGAAMPFEQRLQFINAVFELERSAHCAGIEHLNANLANLKGGR